jgi:hypothetical protein
VPSNSTFLFGSNIAKEWWAYAIGVEIAIVNSNGNSEILIAMISFRHSCLAKRRTYRVGTF